ncbi:MAG: carbohydrate-binding protein [Ruminococcus sp.]|nr:carbohydrate-binding protein [Ruminococcus sp.]
MKKLISTLAALSLLTGMTVSVPSYDKNNGNFYQTEANAADTGSIMGDVNADGQFSVDDAVMMQKFLLGSGNLTDWTKGDFYKDDRIDVFDLCIMRQELLKPADSYESHEYPAIDAQINEGVTETVNSGFKNPAYVNLDNKVGSSMTWTVDVEESGNYKLTFRNANGGKSDRSMKLNISGNADSWKVAFPVTDGWTTWVDSKIVVPLSAGTQTITLTSITADGGPNLDYMALEKTDADIQQPEKAEIIPEGAKQIEALSRGLITANTGKGILTSWRILATDSADTTFKLYKNGTLLKEFDKDSASNYLDSTGTVNDEYTIETYENGVKTDTAKASAVLGNKNSGQSGAYFDIPLDVPSEKTMPDGSTCTYTPNDASVGDVDGDGEYEIILKWDPSNSQDNSKNGYTGNVLLDCYKMDGTKLWRIDLGVNIRAGAHYTQFMVYDYDGDGKAELVCKTSDGTVDGKGKVIGDASADYRSSAGRMLTGNEYLTLFDGQTGAALDTINYKPGRGNIEDWGDNYGNRVDRFVAATAYLDGKTPSVVMGRGYYTRMAVTAYDVVDKKLVERWAYDTGYDSSVAGYGDGNHNCMAADVDGDGKDEIVMGSAVIDDNGKLLYTSGFGHGDALHVGDFDPNNPGLEIFMCHEEEKSGYGISFRDGETGKILFHETATGDTGRCLADNIIAGNDSAEMVGSHNSVVYNTSGEKVCNWSDITKWGQNSVVYWTDTLERAVMDRTMIDQYGKGRVFTGDGVTSNNASKSNASISCDLFGDWREEIVFPTSDGTALRVFTTTYSTDYKIYTLMHNPQYRTQVAGQNVGYNQPPHTDYFLGTGYDLPTFPNVYTK